MSEEVSAREACAVLGLDQEQAAVVLAGPFAPTEGRLDVRQLLGCKIALKLRMLRLDDAVQIALMAASDASADGEPRTLLVGWRDYATPIAAWTSRTVLPDATEALLTVPADRWLRNLQDRIWEFRRAAAGRLN